MAMKIVFMFFFFFAHCGVMVGYQRFGGLCCPEDGGSTVPRKDGIQPPHHRAQQPRKPWIQSNNVSIFGYLENI